jgi:uncharacterized membrane protein YheB (UPF0754 family)
MEIKTFVLLSIPVISALIGWVTNYIAVKMIFRPRKPYKVLFLKFHGLIPRRQKELAKSIASAIERELISHRDIENAIKRPSTQEKIRELIKNHFDDFVNKKFRTNPLFSMVLNAGEFLSIKDIIYDEVLKSLPSFLEKLVKEIETEIDFKELIEQKILQFDTSKLESLVYEIARNELKLIEILGGVLGFMVGCAQVAILLVVEIH